MRECTANYLFRYSFKYEEFILAESGGIDRQRPSEDRIVEKIQQLKDGSRGGGWDVLAVLSDILGIKFIIVSNQQEDILIYESTAGSLPLLQRPRLLLQYCWSKFLSVRSNIGRPRLEEQQTDLLKAICDIAIYGSAAQDKRQFEAIRSIHTLDELKDALFHQGFKLSRSATYLRLLPRRSNTAEGGRHVNPVPVKLQKATNTKHHDHSDGRFCTSTIRSLEELSSLLGPEEVAFLSQDDKARVVIGLTAANKQSPFLMHIEYRVKLPDHNWVVAQRHKLIPSVTAGIIIKKNGLGKPEAVGYSGPTYVGIRSGKHSSSTAYSHALDFKRLTELEEFAPILRHDGIIKPVVVIVVDGGPDENPRYRKVIQVAIHHFLEHNLDAIFIATNAPGRSAFNRVERRMSPLSRELAGLLLPHDHYGSHLDSQMRTTDEHLERQNFKFAGKTLAEVWGGLIIDGYPTVAEFIEPEASEVDPESLECRDQCWFSNHVRTSQYMLQIVKCDNRSCCSPLRSSLSTVLPGRFLPPPIPLIHSSDGLKAAGKDDHQHFPSLFVAISLDVSKILPKSYLGFKKIPYDLFCPSQTNLVNDRICTTCGLYHASLVMLKEHKKEHKVTAATKKIRPKRVVTRRRNELLVATADGGDLDWLDSDTVDLTGIPMDWAEAGSDQQKYAERSKNGVITGPPLKAVEVVATTTTAGWPKMASPSPSVSGEVPESLQDRWHNSNDSGCCEAIEFCQDSGADSVSLM
ncbi:hypothetical protein pipiens_013407 [Culex pipiens pipiens]|uniref:C2H2-type domain-containing protein n=1 Tax=Culex pipiens pipiens TaxID=38569 RepID=A0ABD1CYK3_CULPP